MPRCAVEFGSDPTPMPCFYPLRGYRANSPNANGKFPVVFNFQAGFADQPISLPCGQCIGCRLERSRQWALRCVHESKMHDENMFITLTYADENLPENGSLRVEDWQLFAKRMRDHVRYHYKRKFKFYHCGEYGDRYGRPHYHAIIFGFDFPDKKYKRVNSNGDRIYVSETLTKLWGYGQCEIGSVTYQSAAYVARYILKKITGEDAVAYYGDRKPEYTTMSNGIGKKWFEKYGRDVFPNDFVVHDGKKHRVPRFYDNLYELMPHDIPSVLAMTAKMRLKVKRKKAGAKHAADNTPERRRTREKVQLERLKKLKREVE